MRTVFLGPDDWDRVPEASETLSIVDPHNVVVVAVENDEGEVVASVCILKTTHFEGLWIKPEYRGNAGVFRALIRQAYAIPRLTHERFALATPKVGDSVMRELCHKLHGQQLPYELYALPVGE